MRVVVSSALSGRELAVLKSMINLMQSDGANNWQYIHNSNQHSLFIAQDYHKNGVEYYALVKSREEKIPIGNAINPKVIRELFKSVKLNIVIEQTVPENQKSPDELAKGLYEYVKSQSQFPLLLQLNETAIADEVFVFFSPMDQSVYSNIPLNQQSIKQLQYGVITAFDLKEDAEGLVDDRCKIPIDMTFFFWCLGLSLTERLVEESYASSEYAFRQTSWPNYGTLPFSNDFVSLSSMLWRRAESFDEIVEDMDCDISTITGFLNASMLSGHALVVKNTRPDVRKSSVKKEGFFTLLKRKLLKS